MIPFDLARFDAASRDASSVAQRIQNLALENLGKAGLERESAALLLARLYSR